MTRSRRAFLARRDALRAINAELEPRVMSEAEAATLRRAMAARFAPLSEREAAPEAVRKRG